mgnify:CR=1 FL=1
MDFSFGTDQLSAEYKNHEFFNELTNIEEVYDSLSENSRSFIGTATPVINLDSNLYMAIKGTIKAIRHVFKEGLINDGFTLIRKYNDELLVYMYQRAYILNHNEKWESLEELFKVPKISDWVEGNGYMPYSYKMERYLSMNPKTKGLWECFNGQYFRKVRRFCNDNVHLNSYVIMMLNDNERYMKDREKWLTKAMRIMQNLFTMYLAFIFYVDYHYTMSSDYVDFKEMGMTPPDGSQYWLAPFAQDAFNRYIAPHEGLASFIKKNSPMKIE